MALIGVIVTGFVAWRISVAQRTNPGENTQKTIPATSFEECKSAGNPIQESYPERCVTPDGKSFTNPEQ